jgi:hypothetical protein
MPNGSFDRGTRFSRPGRKADFCARREAPRTENGGEFVDDLGTRIIDLTKLLYFGPN